MRFRTVFSTASFLKEAREKAEKYDGNVLKAAQDLVKGWLYGYAIYYGVWLAAILALLIILSFTELLGGPYVLAQVILFLYLGTLALASLAIYFIWRKVKRKISKLQSSLEQSNVRDVEATDAPSSRVERIEN